MNTLTKKQAILQSLEAMNAQEMDELLTFVRTKQYNEAIDLNYLSFKKRALNEIQEALKNEAMAEA